MIPTFFISVILFSFSVLQPFNQKYEQQNHQKNDEWVWLFNGESTDAWRSVKSDGFPGKGWKIVGNELVVTGGDKSQRGGDIITIDKY